MKQTIWQFTVYLIVGGSAAIVEWLFFYLFAEQLGIHYTVATALAFIVSTFANWLFGRLLLFKGQDRINILQELLKIYATSVAGLLMNLLIMWVAIEKLAIGQMMAKVAATGIVFFWNFLVRKLLIYKI